MANIEALQGVLARRFWSSQTRTGRFAGVSRTATNGHGRLPFLCKFPLEVAIASLLRVNHADGEELLWRVAAHPFTVSVEPSGCERCTEVRSNESALSPEMEFEMVHVIPEEERSLIAQIAALERLGQVGGAVNTAAAREALWRKYLDKVDPQRVLAEEEREKRAAHARRADMARLALKAAQARRAQRESRQRLEQEDGLA